MNDNSYKIQSPTTAQLRNKVEHLLKWCENLQNTATLTTLSVSIIEELNKIFTSSITKSCTYNREKLWRNFYILRTSQRFVKKWTDFMIIANITIEPTLYQHLTDIIFKRQLHNYLKVLHVEQTDETHITEMEGNILRYIAGYICRQLRTKLERNSHKLKEELILCCMDMIKDRDEKESGNNEEWTDLMDRGGLVHVKDTVYQFICAIETEMRSPLNALTSYHAKDTTSILKHAENDENVKYY